MQTLSEFIEQQKLLLDQFKEHWEQNRAASPEDWPATFNPPDWQEQFNFFIEDK